MILFYFNFEVWFQNARAKFRRNITNQICSDKLKQKEINSINQYNTTQNINQLKEINCQNLYPCITTYDYNEEKIDNIYTKSINSDFNLYVHVPTNSNNGSLIDNLIQPNDIQSDLLCSTNNLSSYSDNLSQSVR
ncbi:unnamed protein product [Schistosoma curassoni]|uniref:Homeobox domain-containing protein n=1 Tax=Schistosoma curassoni TaxID=6186 RepID=A0A3P8CRK8_9TREM|nr:unnamed protein product [Schistosoma curassoni]